MNEKIERHEAIGELLDVLVEELAAMDLTRAVQCYPSADLLADRMISSLPDVLVAEPPIGPCYSPRALARWKGISRQAIAKQRSRGKLFAVTVDGSTIFPAIQFDSRGRPLPAFRELWDASASDYADPLAFAVWMHTPDPRTGKSPASVLRSAPDTRSDTQRKMEAFEPTIVQPPTGLSGSAECPT